MTHESYDQLLAEASRVFGVALVRHTNTKASGPCPLCGGRDRFTVWLFEGNGWCSRCGHKDEFRFVSKAERSENAAAKAQTQQAARESMLTCQDWAIYHSNLEAEDALAAVMAQGVKAESVRKWGLGYCPSCPTASEFASVTFPVFYRSRLYDIRHKLLGVPAELLDEVGKYRSHRANMVPHPMNLDAIDQYDDINVIEGEKKTIVLDEHGIHNVVGIPGIGLLDDLLHALAQAPRKDVRIALDPDAMTKSRGVAAQIASLGRHRVWIADPFMKPDDLVRKYGANAMRSVFKQARRA